MRTTLDLDDQLMHALMARHPGETKTRAVEAAIAERIWETLVSLPWAELDADWRVVGATGGHLRRDGRTLPLTDLVIAVAAAHAGYTLWTFDTDFERIRAVFGELELYG